MTIGFRPPTSAAIVAELVADGRTNDPAAHTSGPIVRMRPRERAAQFRMSADAFTRTCESLDFPMTVVTAFDGREHSGCLVGFHTQCSIEPRRWLVCISKANHTCGVAERAEWLAVHLLRDDQHALAQFFGGGDRRLDRAA